jgi:GT2 family glycosyltransferase
MTESEAAAEHPAPSVTPGPPSEESARVTVIVVTWQGAHLLEACLDSLSEQSTPCDVIVVDNASSDGTQALLAARSSGVRVVTLSRNTGFAGGVAAALPLVLTPFVALLNNDAAASPSWLEQSIAALGTRPAAAAVAARMLLWTDEDSPATINNAGVELVAGGYGTDRGLGERDGPAFDTPREVFGFSGGAAVLRAEAVRAVGGMPADFFLYYEDTDLSWRLRLSGWQIWYEPGAVVRHRHAASSDVRSDLFAFYTERNRLLMLLRCAPATTAGAELCRFVVTTISLQIRRLAGQQVRPARVFNFGLRLRVIVGVLGQLPAALRARRRIDQHKTVPRRTVADRWLKG